MGPPHGTPRGRDRGVIIFDLGWPVTDLNVSMHSGEKFDFTARHQNSSEGEKRLV